MLLVLIGTKSAGKLPTKRYLSTNWPLYCGRLQDICRTTPRFYLTAMSVCVNMQKTKLVTLQDKLANVSAFILRL